ncbi:hypothetical protein L195_g050869 [Trifolium pratense]|uniref:Uncharacterized protein n=1 Tax=Trifolium pratense TaxID=57577 RepID=A0A2K3JWI5_TRIPR|nr:hypothetical protein L195_g050869 [Trifolium pratense]
MINKITQTPKKLGERVWEWRLGTSPLLDHPSLCFTTLTLVDDDPSSALPLLLLEFSLACPSFALCSMFLALRKNMT